MGANRPVKNLREKKRDSVYYLMQDILSCFPDNFESNFLSAANHHFVAKEATKQILVDEIKQEKPRFRILAGVLILQNAFLRQMQRVALYEVIDIVSVLKFCFYRTSFKTIKRLSAQVVLRLFCTLYFEYIIMPRRKKEGKPFISRFKEYFSANDIIDVMNTGGVFPRFIFESHGIELGFGKEANTRLKEILGKFYLEEN